MLCLRLTAQPVDDTLLLDENGWPCLEAEDAGANMEVPAENWLHVSYMNFKDMECALLKLRMEPEHQTQPGRIVLDVPATSEPQVHRSCAVFASMDLTSCWRATWYKIVTDSEILPIRKFVPNIVEVVELDEQILPSEMVWSGLDSERSRRREANCKKRGHAAPRRRGARGKTSAPAKKRQKHLRSAGDDDAAAAGPDDDVPGPEEPDALSSAESGSFADAEDYDEGEGLDAWEKIAEIAACVNDDGSLPGAAAAAAGVMEPPVAAAPADAHSAAPATPAERAPAASRKKTVVEETFDVTADGQVVGTLHYNPRTNTMTAHCNFDGHLNCRKQRTCSAGGKPGQGRPLGFLCGWLRDGVKWDHAADHVHRSTAAQKLQHRQESRALFMSHRNSEAFSQHERPQRPGEGVEPEVFS